MLHELLTIFNMKYLVFVIAFLSLTHSSFSSNHIKFLGIEVNKSVRAFQDSLCKRGFKTIKKDKNTYRLYGKLVNEIVTLKIIATPKTHNVCKVIVLFPKKTTWEKLRIDYFNKKEMYFKKYSLDSEYEFFSDPYEDGDGYELRAVSNDKCRYATFFNAEGGHICVEIGEGSQIKITYEDTENINLAQKEFFNSEKNGW